MTSRKRLGVLSNERKGMKQTAVQLLRTETELRLSRAGFVDELRQARAERRRRYPKTTQQIVTRY